MRALAKVAAVIVMILSALLFLVTLAGIYGTWWGRGQGITLVTSVAATGDQALARGQELIGQADQVVARGQTEVNGVTTRITSAGATVADANLAVAALEKILDTDLSPTIQGAQARAQDLRETVGLIDQMTSLARRLPGQRDSRLLDTVDNLVNMLASIDQSIKDTRAALQQAKGDKIDQIVAVVTAPLNRATNALNNARAGLSQVDRRLTDERARLAALTQQIINYLTVAAIVLTLACLWMALAQLGLFLHAWGVLTGRDPLARWHRRPQSQGAAAPQVTTA